MSEEPNVLVLLTGGRIQPAALLAATLNLRSYGLVLPHGDSRLRVEAERLLAELFPSSRYLGAREVDAYRPDHSRQAVRELVELDPEGRAAVSLVGAPLPMALGAYDLCRECGYRPLYLNTQAGEVIDFSLPGSHPIRLRVGVDRFLLMHGAKVRPSPPWPYPLARRELAGMATLLAHGGRVTEELMARLRAAPLDVDDCSAGVRRLAHSLVKVGILIAESPGHLLPVGEFKQWLNGVWLEHYVADQARDARDAQGQQLFDQVRQGLQVDLGGAERELDLVALRAATALVGSCKTGGSLRKGDLDELAAVGAHLGGDYCVRLFFTHLVRQGRPSAWSRFEAQAARNRVVVLSGEDLPRLAEILVREALTPTFGRK